MNEIHINGKNCSSKELLFKELSEKLNFPVYFSQNWDSFEEIINDLNSFLPELKIIYITDYDKLIINDLEEKTIFKEIIHACNNSQTNYKFYAIKEL